MGAPQATLLCLLALAAAAAAQDAAPPAPLIAEKYPLRLHILAVDDTHRTRRLQPNWCAGSAPDALAGGDSSPCGASGSSSLGGGDDDFSGAGRADLVSPPSGITGLNFTYEGCSRLRVAPGFYALGARWVKPGTKLEVELAGDPARDSKAHPEHCMLKVVPQEFIYLRMRNRALIRVTQEAYASKPSLRVFLSGGPETLVRRPPVE
jgi:hypothetical protein